MSYIPKLPGAIQDVVAVYQTEHLAESNENKQSENKKDCSSSKKSRRKFTRQRGNNPTNLEASKIPTFKTSKNFRKKKHKKQPENAIYNSSFSSNSDSDSNLDTNDLSFTSKVVNNVLDIKGEFIQMSLSIYKHDHC